MAIQKITSGILADGAIVAADIANGSVTDAKIAAVANTKITGLVTASQIANVANTQVTGLVTASQIANVANTQLTGSIEATQVGTTVSQLFGMRNRIINGAMEIDQRNAGASVTIDQTGGTYTLDRWYGRDDSDGAYSIQQVSDAPTGFTNSLKITITTTDSSLSAAQYGFVGQFIEGYNTADLSFGTASAKTLTLSFWVKGSVTGQFGGSITNSAQDRTYPFSYTISTANTWEQKTVTVTGDTTGTWLTTNGAGIGVNFAVGIGSNFLATANTWASSFKMSATGQTNLYATSAATLQFTGVQLEVGSSATPFERRMYGTELALCQRYYFRATADTGGVAQGGVSVFVACNASEAMGPNEFPVTMRAAPTITFFDNAGTQSSVHRFGIADVGATVTAGWISTGAWTFITKSSGWATGNVLGALWNASAEL